MLLKPRLHIVMPVLLVFGTTHAYAQNIPGIGQFAPALNNIFHSTPVPTSAPADPAPQPWIPPTRAQSPQPAGCPPYMNVSLCGQYDGGAAVRKRAAARETRDRTDDQIALLYSESRKLLSKPLVYTTQTDMDRLRAMPAEYERLAVNSPSAPRGPRVWWEKKLPPLIAQKQAALDASHH